MFLFLQFLALSDLPERGEGGRLFLPFLRFFPLSLSLSFSPPCPERPDSQATDFNDFTSSHNCCFCLRCSSLFRTPRSLVPALILPFLSSLQPHPSPCTLLTLIQQGCVISKLGRFTKLEHFEDGFLLSNSRLSRFTQHITFKRLKCFQEHLFSIYLWSLISQ